MNTALFRFVNSTLKTPWLDRVVPVFSDKDYIVIPGIVAVALALYFGNRRVRTAILALIIALGCSDAGSERVLKNLFDERRPYAEIEGVNLHRGNEWQVYNPANYAVDPRKSNAFPSSHAANVAAIAGTLATITPQTLYVTVPLALAVGFSRVYTGNHYPGDVLGGYGWGLCCAFGAVWLSRRVVRRICGPEPTSPPETTPLSPERKTLYVLLAAWTLMNFLFVHTNGFTLAGDEAQYWDWSRRLDLSYYSKPPMIAYVIGLLAGAGGNKEWAIRSGAVLLSSLTLALIHALTVRITRRERAGLIAVAALMAMPFSWVGSVLMTIDPLLIACWTAALYTFHRAVNGDRGMWLLTGLALGLGMLSKYTMAFAYLVFALYLLLLDRRWLRRPQPYVAVLISLACLSGVLYWNYAHDWVSLRHTAAIGADESGLSVKSVGRVFEYVGAQAGLVSPLLFGFLAWAAWKTTRRFREDRDMALLSLAALVVFGGYALISLTHRPQANWPVAAYPAAACALGALWTTQERSRRATGWLFAALALGCVLGVAVRSTSLAYTLSPQFAPPQAREDRLYLPGGLEIAPGKDPTNELVGGRELGQALSKYEGSEKTLAPFIFSDRYQMTALAAFYTPGRPRTYCMSFGDRRLNQYDLWGGWNRLVGKDGIFVTGGDESRARLFIEGMLQRGAFKQGEYLETVEIWRGPVLVKTYTISRLFQYSGYDWTANTTEF